MQPHGQPLAPRQVQGGADFKPLLQLPQLRQVRKVLRIARRAEVWVQHIMAYQRQAALPADDPEDLPIHLIHASDN